MIAATLPLAFAMVAGPQIISAFFFATSPKWKSDCFYSRAEGDFASRVLAALRNQFGGHDVERGADEEGA